MTSQPVVLPPIKHLFKGLFQDEKLTSQKLVEHGSVMEAAYSLHQLSQPSFKSHRRTASASLDTLPPPFPIKRARAHTTSGYPLPTQPHRYNCPHCSKSFSRPSSLRIHIYSHTGEKPFTCQYPGCGRSFNVHSNMRRHLRVHYYPQKQQSQIQNNSMRLPIVPSPSLKN